MMMMMMIKDEGEGEVWGGNAIIYDQEIIFLALKSPKSLVCLSTEHFNKSFSASSVVFHKTDVNTQQILQIGRKILP